MSHPSRVRGLKQSIRLNLYIPRPSHPSRVRGLKLTNAVKTRQNPTLSHPSRVRGLKPLWKPLGVVIVASHPSRVRGLKLSIYYSYVVKIWVAPLAGAWIETDLFEEGI